MSGKLFVCATPIGNLEDVSLRLLNVLKQVDLITAEDTRRTVKLLNKYKISTHITSYNEYKRDKEKKLIKLIVAGKNIALVSDAGTPTISDPGASLIKAAIKNSVPVVPIPGPCAIILALAASGLNITSFVYTGYLPKKEKQRKEFLSSLINEKRPVVIFESPYRLIVSLNDIKDILGEDKYIIVCRELTKKFEEIIRAPVKEVLDILKNKKIRGEITLIIAGQDLQK